MMRRSPFLRLGATTGAALVAVALLAPVPAGATPAPLVTEDALGLRVDVTALDGPVLDAIEDDLDTVVEAVLDDVASDPTGPFGPPKTVAVAADVDATIDVVAPGSAHPDGALLLDVDLTGIELDFTMDPPWPFADCHIGVEADPGAVGVAAEVDHGVLPDPPFATGAPLGTWDQEPMVSTTGVCWTYVDEETFSTWWTETWDAEDPDSAAGRIQAEVASALTGLADDVWADLVLVPVAGLNPFGVILDTITTDDDGFLVVARTDATAGITLPGVPGGPYVVSNAPDAGSTTTLAKVLQERDQVIVSLHPNVRNQLEEAFALAGVPFDPGVLDLAPIELSSVPVNPCVLCGPYVGDDRITAVYEVG